MLAIERVIDNNGGHGRSGWQQQRKLTIMMEVVVNGCVPSEHVNDIETYIKIEVIWL